jgi:hypothetical protein
MGDTAWYVARDGQQLDGSFTTDQVVGMVRQAPGAAILVWREGMAGWSAPAEVPELASAFGAATAPPPSPPGAGLPPAAPSATGSASAEVKQQLGFLRSLFDLRFRSMVTPRMLSVLYAVSMLLVALGLVAMVVSGVGTMITGFRFERWGMVLMGLVWIVLSPVLSILYLALIRMFYELVMVIFQLREDVGRIAARD